MKTTRQRILETLESHRSASAAELSQALNLTPADIRYHLAALITDGSIERAELGTPHKRGRPTGQYRLTQDYLKHHKHNLDILATGLLGEISQMLGKDHFIVFLAQLAEKIGPDGNLAVRNPSRVLFQAIQRLNVMNYQAHWEAHARAPQVIFSHCPYLAILEDHPEMCQFDKSLLEKMLGSRVNQAAKRKLDREGALQCIFLVEREGTD